MPIAETGPFATEHVERLLRRLAYEVGRAAKSPHEAEVHDLRVAIRRFTQALAAFESCFPAKEAKNIKRRLRKIMGLAGEVRDCDIAIGLLSRSKAPPASLLSAFRTQRKEAGRDLTGALRRWSQRQSYSKWRACLGHGGRGRASHDPIGVTAEHTLKPMLREFLSGGKRALRAEATAEWIHHFRIAARKLRYTLELFVPAYGSSLDGWLEQMRALQTVLGTIRDCETVRVMIRRQGGDVRIDSALRRKVARNLGEFRQLWADSFSDASIQRLVSQINQAVPGTPMAEPGLRAAHA